jgi:protoheme IX farnesyltransferase
MAPLVWGERATKQQMLWYTGVLVPLTLLPGAYGELGPIYLVTAIALDAALLVAVVRVARAAAFARPAWSLYKFSLLYLALLFAAMVADRTVLA